MSTKAGEDAARRMVLAFMSERELDNAAMAKLAKIDVNTLGDFLAGKRWPRTSTLGKLDKALGLTPGTLAAVGEELMPASAPETVSAAPDAGSALIFRRPDAMTDRQWNEFLAENLEYLEWQAERASRER